MDPTNWMVGDLVLVIVGQVLAVAVLAIWSHFRWKNAQSAVTAQVAKVVELASDTANSLREMRKECAVGFSAADKATKSVEDQVDTAHQETASQLIAAKSVLDSLERETQALQETTNETADQFRDCGKDVNGHIQALAKALANVQREIAIGNTRIGGGFETLEKSMERTERKTENSKRAADDHLNAILRIERRTERAADGLVGLSETIREEIGEVKAKDPKTADNIDAIREAAEKIETKIDGLSKAIEAALAQNTVPQEQPNPPEDRGTAPDGKAGDKTIPPIEKQPIAS